MLFSVAAVTVAAPRLALAFLAADGVDVPTSWRIHLLAVSSVATAVMLTGGTAYLAHAIAVTSLGRGVLIALWIAALAVGGAHSASDRSDPSHAAARGRPWHVAALERVDLCRPCRQSRGFRRDVGRCVGGLSKPAAIR